MQRQEIGACFQLGIPICGSTKSWRCPPIGFTRKSTCIPIWMCFADTTPTFPCSPALQCECAFQAAAVLLIQTEMAAEGGVPVIARMNNVKFRRMVRPGDTLDIHVELTQRARRLLHMQGTLKVGGKISCQLEFVATEASSGAAD